MARPEKDRYKLSQEKFTTKLPVDKQSNCFSLDLIDSSDDIQLTAEKQSRLAWHIEEKFHRVAE